ncbi:hypothetical protein [Nonomuraea dietziae]|uniref:hypothetical protein n=1 Tax=Nonomuraea dietziae TaxID=65515 RepID=UPI0031CE679E
MTRSCSDWMVATMSRILPVRFSSRAASSAASPFSVALSSSLSPSRSSRSSSTPITSRPRVCRWRRRVTPMGAVGVAR